MAITRTAFAAAFLCGLLQSAAWADSTAGIAALKRGDTAAALREFEAAAKTNDPVAEAYLGGMYMGGDGVAKDYQAAMKWSLLAAEQGNANGQTQVATLYANGWGVPQDIEKAVKLLRVAAEKGDLLGQIGLGTCYRKGLGVARDDAETLKWYRRAAAQRSALGLQSLGSLYADGVGVQQDNIAATALLGAAAHLYQDANHPTDMKGATDIVVQLAANMTLVQIKQASAMSKQMLEAKDPIDVLDAYLTKSAVVK